MDGDGKRVMLKKKKETMKGLEVVLSVPKKPPSKRRCPRRKNENEDGQERA